MKTFERTAFKSESVIVISCSKKPLGCMCTRTTHSTYREALRVDADAASLALPIFKNWYSGVQHNW